MPKLYLIDGNAYVHRAYHALPPLSTSRGEMVNAVYGFIRLLLKVEKAGKPDYMAVCFDYPAATFRHKAYAQYKAHRKEIDEELKSQMPLAREAVRALNITVVEKQGYEADDLIATLARSASKDGADVVIVTADKDAFQLVNERIHIYNEYKDFTFSRDHVKEKYGLFPEELSDMFALMGDASDNIPGAKGIGEKTAVKLIQEYGSVENLLAHTDSLKGKLKENITFSAQDILLSKQLVILDDKVPLDITWNDAKRQPPREETIVPFLQRLEFNSLIDEIVPLKETAQKSGTAANIPTRVILDENELDELVLSLKKAEKMSIDLETTSTDPHKAGLVGFALAPDPSQAFYIPVGHAYEGVGAQLPTENVLSRLKDVFEDRHIMKYGQNIKYDYLVLRYHGITLASLYFDTMIASYCINPSRFTHNLKGMALDYLGIRMTPIEELIGTGAKQTTMSEVTIETAAPYAGADAAVVLELEKKLEPELKNKNLDPLFHDIEMPLVEVLAQMEERGIKVNLSYVSTLSLNFLAMMKEIEKDIYRLAGQEFNPNSTKQLAVILFDKLGLPAGKKTKTGYSTNEEVLTALAPLHPLPARLLDYRELQKLKSTYIDSLMSLTDPLSGRVHTSLNQTVTATGRLSSSEPNLQNIPIRSDYGLQIRRAFVPEDNFIFLSADYSQIDLRVLAHVSEDPALTKAFLDGEDVHTATACELFGAGPEGITDELRRTAKAINFGIIYGMSAFGLAQQLNISNQKAKEYIDRYFTRYAGVREWIERCLREARQNGYVTTVTGRLRYLPEINSANGQIRKFAERTAMNTPIQGTSADIIKIAMIQLDKHLKTNRSRVRMLMQVHDDLLFEVPDEELQATTSFVKTIMETSMKLRVPLKVDLSAGKNWADLNEI